MAIGGPGFSQIYEQHKLGRLGLGADDHLRGDKAGTRLYTHSAFSISGFGGAAAAQRREKWEAGATQVKQAIDREYGAGMGDRVFAKINAERAPGARNIDHELVRGDLASIKRTIDEFRNPMQVLAKLPGIGDVDTDSGVQNSVVRSMVDLIGNRLAAERAKGREGEPAMDTLRAIRREIEDDPSSHRILKSKALSIVDKAEAQLRMGDEMEQAAAYRGFPTEDGWRMLLDGRHQEVRGEYGFENEQGYMAGMLNGFTRMLESVRKHEPLTPELFQTLHDTCTSKVYSKGVVTEDVPREGALKQGYRTDDGSNVGVGFPFKRATLGGEPPRYTGGTTTPEGRAELEERIAAERTATDRLNAQERERATAEGREPKIIEPFFEIMPGVRDAPDKLWCNKRSAEACSARVDGIVKAYEREIAAAGGDETAKLRAIARCCQDLDQSHVFEDGNIRTVAFLVMNKLLAENGLSPAILAEPNCFDGFSIDQLVTEIRAGQATFQGRAA